MWRGLTAHKKNASKQSQVYNKTIIRYFPSWLQRPQKAQAPLLVRITFSALMLALVFLFQYLEQFMPFGTFGFVKFNLALAFILITLSFAGFPFALLLLCLRFAIGPLLSGNGYAPIGVIGQIILLIAGLLAVSIYYLLSSVKAIEKQRLILRHGIKLVIVTISVSLILAMLNALLFTPWYISVGKSSTFSAPLSIKEMIAQYPYLTQFYFFIPNYWAAQFAVYIVFNVINLTINLFIHYLLLRITPIIAPVSTY